MKYFISLSFCFFIIMSNTVSAQKTWCFKGNNPLVSNDGKNMMTLHSVKQMPEFVDGIDGKALRTDGYSTWISTTIKKATTLSGWFALESFPTDTAAFIGIQDNAKNTIAVCTDRFGKLLFGIKKNGLYTYRSLNTSIKCFSWLNL